MTADELMQMSAEEAIKELDWKSIEFLFRPSNQFELLLRCDLSGVERVVSEWAVDDSPDAMPHRFRYPYLSQMNRAIDMEKFYRKLKQLHGVKEESKSDQSSSLQAKTL